MSRGKYSDIGEPKVIDAECARRALIRDIKRNNCEEAIEEVIDGAFDAWIGDGMEHTPDALRAPLRYAFEQWSRRKS
jgi:hypothetical protein